MRFDRNFIAFLIILIVCSFASRSAAAQENMLQPSDLFPDFPEVKWGMSIADAKKAIEKTGVRAAHPVETELGWDGRFVGSDGRGSLRFSDKAELSEIVVQLYYSENGKEMYETWLKKLTEKHGAAKETVSEDVTSKFWQFKNGFSIELRLLKGEGENRYMTDLHWVKS